MAKKEIQLQKATEKEKIGEKHNKLVSQYRFVNNIFGIRLVRVIEDINAGSRSTAWECNISLTMRKRCIFKVQSYMIHRLPLGFVDCHGKCQSDWKLALLHDKTKLRLCWIQSNAWYENSFSYSWKLVMGKTLYWIGILTFLSPIQKAHLKHSPSYMSHHCPCTIAHTLGWCQVAQYHNWAPNLELQLC